MHLKPNPNPSPNPNPNQVLLEYELTGVAITVTERDGAKHVSRLKWG